MLLLDRSVQHAQCGETNAYGELQKRLSQKIVNSQTPDENYIASAAFANIFIMTHECIGFSIDERIT
jgi:hypothetical protein